MRPEDFRRLRRPPQVPRLPRGDLMGTLCQKRSVALTWTLLDKKEARTLLGAPGFTTRSKDATRGAPGLTTRSKGATRGSWPYY